MAHLQSTGDEPGTKREYETIYIVSPDVTSERLLQINDRVRKVIDGDQGRLLHVENWGKRKLAYKIRKQTKGIYLYWRYLGASQLVAEIERNLRMLDDVVRYQTVKVDADVDPNARPGGVDEESFQAAADIPPEREEEPTPHASSYERGEDEFEEDADRDGPAGGAEADESPELDHDDEGEAGRKGKKTEAE
jgi:small subunit ribosomal protein S6